MLADLSGRWLWLGLRAWVEDDEEEDGVEADVGDEAAMLGDEAPNRAATCDGDEKLVELTE